MSGVDIGGRLEVCSVYVCVYCILCIVFVTLISPSEWGSISSCLFIVHLLEETIILCVYSTASCPRSHMF